MRWHFDLDAWARSRSVPLNTDNEQTARIKRQAERVVITPTE